MNFSVQDLCVQSDVQPRISLISLLLSIPSEKHMMAGMSTFASRQIVHRHYPTVLRCEAGAHATKLLHVPAHPEVQHDVLAERPDGGSRLTADM